MTGTASAVGWPDVLAASPARRPDGLGWPVAAATVDVSRETPAAADTAPEPGTAPEPEDTVELPADDDTPLARELAHDTRRRRALHGQRLPAPPHTR